MRYQFLARMGAVAVVVAAMSLAPLAGQTPSSPTAKTWTPPRTPDGHPDLQGIWSNATITPLERPAEFAGKQVLTDQDVAALEERAAQGRVDRPPRDGDPGTYNQLWFDRGTKVVPTRQTSLIVDPPDGKMPALTPAAQKREAADAEAKRRPFGSYADIDTGERCITDGIPFAPYAYNNNYQILQTRDHVVILHEMFRELRIIPLDGRPHLGPGVRQWFGDPRGHWEGNTLVIDTTNFADKTSYVWAGNWRASRPTVHLVERFTRVNADTINYEFTIDDPAMFTRPWTAVTPMTKSQGPIFEYACHEGNYSIQNVLRGARAQEAQETAKKGSR